MSSEYVDLTPGVVTPYRALDEVLVAHAHSLSDALADDFVGLYPIGSVAIGDFDLTSDVDFLVVTADELATEAVKAIQAVHTGCIEQDSRWVRHLEYSFISIDELRRFSSPYAFDGERVERPERDLWYFGNGSPSIERSDHDNTLVTRWTLRYASSSVSGPAPTMFAPDVTQDALRREIRSSLIGWDLLLRRDPSKFFNRFHQAFLVLNNCRALQDLHEGRITSKREGVRWAMAHVDPAWHELIDFCWREREDTGIHVSQPADPWRYEQMLDFLAHGAGLAAAYPVAEVS
jgi:hypothetical protein